jgi:hypothetical protein
MYYQAWLGLSFFNPSGHSMPLNKALLVARLGILRFKATRTCTGASGPMMQLAEMEAKTQRPVPLRHRSCLCPICEPQPGDGCVEVGGTGCRDSSLATKAKHKLDHI